MGCYVYPLNDVSAGAKAERVNFTPALTFLSGASAEERESVWNVNLLSLRIVRTVTQFPKPSNNIACN